MICIALKARDGGRLTQLLQDVLLVQCVFCVRVEEDMQALSDHR